MSIQELGQSKLIEVAQIAGYDFTKTEEMFLPSLAQAPSKLG